MGIAIPKEDQETGREDMNYQALTFTLEREKGLLSTLKQAYKELGLLMVLVSVCVLTIVTVNSLHTKPWSWTVSSMISKLILS